MCVIAAGRVSSFAWKFIRIIARSKRLCRALIGSVINRFTAEELGIDLRLLTGPEDTLEFTPSNAPAIETLSILVRANIEMLSGSAHVAKFAQQISQMLIEEKVKLIDKKIAAGMSLVEFGSVDGDTAGYEDEFSEADDDLVGLSFADLEAEATPKSVEAEPAMDDATVQTAGSPVTERRPILQRARNWMSRVGARVRSFQSRTKAALMFTSMAFVAAVMGSVGGVGVIFTGIVLSIILFLQGLSYASDTRKQSASEEVPPSEEETITSLSPPVPEQGLETTVPGETTE